MSFQNFSNYRFAFNRLDSKLASPDAQKRYYNKWMQKYATIFKGEEKVSVAVEWDLRCRKALREIFSSATFFIEAKKDLEMKCFSSYYFCVLFIIPRNLFEHIFGC